MIERARPASFDSASAMVGAVAAYLHGRPVPLLGHRAGRLLRPLLVAANHLPLTLRQDLYSRGSGREALSHEAVAGARAENLAARVVSSYDRRPYPAVVVGSTPGAVAHLCAALGAPLLPQTFLLPLGRRPGDPGDPDDPAADVRAAEVTARAALDANPGLVLHQMLDPSSDRLTLRWFSYLRFKRHALGPAYEAFLLDTLPAGATIFVCDCRHRWPVTTVGPRHLFQFGGAGDLGPEELRHGSDRVASFLARQGSARRGWDPPPPDTEAPEAEWGFDQALGEEVDAFAARHGYRVRHIVFDRALDLSPLVADLYRWWYARLGRPGDRLFVESFVLLDPWWALRASAVPFWLTFNTEAAADELERYLGTAPAYGRIGLTVVSNGVHGVGMAPVERWEALAAHARAEGHLAGVDPRRYPADLGVFARFKDPLRRSGPHWPLPPPLGLAQLDRFLRESGGRHRAVITST